MEIGNCAASCMHWQHDWLAQMTNRENGFAAFSRVILNRFSTMVKHPSSAAVIRCSIGFCAGPAIVRSVHSGSEPRDYPAWYAVPPVC